MFGLYPAGPAWVRHFTAPSTAREVQQLLVKHADFTAGLFHQPYGNARGAVIALRKGFVVMADDVDAAEPDLVVAPDVELSGILWSYISGYANQWSPRELRALTGCDSWETLLAQAGTWYREACTSVEKAVEGTLVAPAPAPAPAPVDPVIAAVLPDDDDVPWVPSEYLHDSPAWEGMPCGH